MTRDGEVWERRIDEPHDGAFVVLWAIKNNRFGVTAGYRVLWIDGPMAGRLDRVTSTFQWGAGQTATWKRIA